jgi:HEAT repeat protein
VINVNRIPDLVRRSIESKHLKERGLATLVLATHSRRLLIAGGLPILLEALRSQERGVAFSAVGWLAGCGEHARPALASLIEMLSDPDPLVCHNAAWALGAIGLAEPEVLVALHAAREHSDERMRTAAEAALVTVGQRPKS